VFFIIFVVITVIRLAVSDSHSSRNNNFRDFSNNPDFRELLEKSRVRSDSVYHIPKVDIKPMKMDSNFQKIMKMIDTTSINRKKSVSDSLRAEYLKELQILEKTKDSAVSIEIE